MPILKRSIRKEEALFIKGLLNLAKKEFLIPNEVIELADGGMGSLQFSSKIQPEFDVIIEVKYIDSDNIPVLISLRSKKSELTEIDFWKVDFSSIKTYPTIENVEILNP